MEALKIIFGIAALAADIAFMFNIKRFADALFPVDGKKKGPGCAGTQTRGCRKMTDAVYQTIEMMSSPNFENRERSRKP